MQALSNQLCLPLVYDIGIQVSIVVDACDEKRNSPILESKFHYKLKQNSLHSTVISSECEQSSYSALGQPAQSAIQLCDEV